MTPMIRVLLVDDDEVTLAAHQRLLAAFSEVHVASSGEAALQILGERGPFGVAVVDIGVADMPGTGLLEELRNRSPETVRVVVTVIDDLPSAIEVFNTCGVFRYLTKPCKPVALTTAVREAVGCFQRAAAERADLHQVFDGIVQLLTGEITSVAGHTQAQGTGPATGAGPAVADDLRPRNGGRVDATGNRRHSAARAGEDPGA
jgi:DNA-binding NtrC family response regulator